MAAADDEPPYLVTETDRGACKQAGAVRGFHTAALEENSAAVWQTALTPVVLVALPGVCGPQLPGTGAGGGLPA